MVEGRSIPSVALQERLVETLFQIHGLESGTADEVLNPFGIEQLPQDRKSCIGDDVTLMWNGPGEWLFESEFRPADETLRLLRERFVSTDATVTDLSSARTIVRISGSSRRDFLKKGCPADIDAMTGGDVITSLIGHFTATIHCRSDSFDVYVLQSFGTDFWHWCRQSIREFNI
ncbi:MAG: hypothetical protein OXI60_08825 [Acidiferrobacterales bacterium]|nr:hypothetical protein [Acidiferrobacterales bacterium]